MVRNTFIASLLASGAVVLASTTPVHAGEVERAREAIAAADAKIHTAETLGAGVEVPARTAEARAVLEHAKADFASGHRDRAIEGAVRASTLADTAIGDLQRRKDEAAAAAQAAAHDSVAASQDQTAAAQQQAAAANARADAAEQAAARSAADAEAARNAAAAAQTAPAQVDTTVTTQRNGTSHRSTRTHVTRRATVPASGSSDEVTTTTSVTQH